MSNLIGQTLGSYRVLAQIGRGGMATVYKAYHPAMDRYVAIKVLPPHFMQDPTFVERFEREARTIARLEHPHILPVHDYGKAPDGTTYLVMRYIEAGTLSDRLKQGPLTLDETLNFLSQIGDALAYAHEQGVIHRDLKPSNVLVDPRGQAFLTDFGLAKIMGGDSNLTGNMIVGTPSYMAPEQGRGQPADKRSDIYSLGIILYEMVTGRTPFEAETPMAVMIKHMTESLPLPTQLNPDLPPAVERIILKALAKEPDGRYQHVGEMISALQKAVADSPTLASTPEATLISEKKSTPLPLPPSPSPSRPAWLIPVAIGSLLLLVLIMGGIGLSLFFGRSVSPGDVETPGAVIEATLPSEEPLTQTEPSPTDVPSQAEEEVEVTPVPTEEALVAPPTGSSPWQQFSNTQKVHAITGQDDLIWIGTEGGLVVWDRLEGSHQKFTTADGLPDNNILSLLLSSEGDLWAGTEGGGIVYFDGQDWTTFNMESGLTADEVVNLFETRQGELLAGTFYGEEALSQFNGERWEVADLPPLPVEYPKPVAFVQDQAGNLIVGLSDEGGLFYGEGDQWQQFTTSDGLPSNTIRDLAYDPAGNLWVVTDQPGGIGIFDKEIFTPALELAEIQGTVLHAASNDNLWLGTDYAGLWYFEDQHWSRYGEEETLLQDSITSIFQDEEGLLWLGTLESGLFNLEGQNATVWAIDNEPSFNSAQHILETGEGQLWFVPRYGGEEIAIYDPGSDTWDRLETPGDTQVITITPDDDIWFGTSDGLWQVTANGARRRFTSEDGLPGNTITALILGEDGGLWVGTETGLVYHHPDDDVMWRDFTDYIPSPHVTVLYADPDGQIWIGAAATEDRPAGVAWGGEGFISGMWLAGHDLPEALKPVQESVAGYPFPDETEGIISFATDGEGDLWVGSWSGGLWRFTPDENEWRSFDETDGAPSGDVLTIAAGSEGTVWFGTWYDNLWGFHPDEGWWQETPEDGLPGQAIFASHITEDDSLWIATESGLARYLPE